MIKKNARGIGCGLVVIALIAGAFLLFGGLGGNDNIPQTGSSAVGEGGRLGRPFAARALDNSGCPVGTDDQFFYDESIYVGYDESLIPQGSELFARLSYEGDPVEDTPAITADQDMRTCVWFEFEPGPDGFFPGDYTADLFVNGNRADTVRFQVDDDSSAGAVVPGQNQSSGQLVELGRLTTTTQVDDSGCPVDTETSFFPDEAVYLAAEQSYIPAGTEVFARLLYEGDVVEDAPAIVADRDMESCVWFVFEPTTREGFFPGQYSAELYVNGQLADQVPFTVQ